MGSWKIMLMSAPRMWRISDIGRDRISRPSNQISPATISPGGMSISRMMVSAVTLLPQPGLPYQSQRLAALDPEVHSVDRRNRSVHDVEVGLQAAHFEQDVGRWRRADDAALRRAGETRSRSTTVLIFGTWGRARRGAHRR